MAGGRNVPHQERSPSLERSRDLIQQDRRTGLVVHGVKGHDEVEVPGLRQR